MSRIISRWKDKKKATKSSTTFTTDDENPPPPSPSPSSLSSSPSHTSMSGTRKSYRVPPRTSMAYSTGARPNTTCVPGHIRPVTCTNFLHGGTYYPGKDKRRNHLRRKTLWYRIFCSSTLRIIATSILCLYVVVVFIALPTLETIYKYGHLLSSRGSSSSWTSLGPKPSPTTGTGAGTGTAVDYNDTNFDDLNKPITLRNGLVIQPVDIMQQDADALHEKLEEIKKRPENVKAYNKILKDIVPELAKAVLGPDDDDEEEEEEKEEEEDDDIDIPSKLQNEEEKEIGENLTSQKTLIRTLRNQKEYYKISHCPRDGVDDISVTLVLQTTLDRIKLLQTTCARWKANIIVSVYITQTEFDNQWDDIVTDYTNLCSNVLLKPHIAKSDQERDLEYPINQLRNEALDFVTSSHVLVLDMDMIPSENLHKSVLDAIALAIERRMDDDGDNGLDPLDAIVVPAFERKMMSPPCETLDECHEYIEQDESFIPKTMEELKKNILNKECIVFQSDVNWEGHFDTNTKEWLESSYSDSNALKIIDCFHSQRYEPYVVLPWCALERNVKMLIMRRAGPRSTYYDERFVGYGKNKIQNISHLRKKGYVFMVMPPTGFLTHYPHPESRTKEVWNNKQKHDLHEKMDTLYSTYLRELEKVYRSTYEVTDICKRAYD